MERLYKEKLWRCLSCNKTNYSKQKISEHVEVYHIDWPRGLPCTHPKCKSRLKTRQGLKSHLRKIHNVRPGTGRPGRKRWLRYDDDE